MKGNEADEKLSSEILNLQPDEATFLKNKYFNYYKHWYDYPAEKETRVLLICESPPMPNTSIEKLKTMNDSQIAKKIPYFYNEDCPPDCRRRAYKIATTIFDGINCDKWWNPKLEMRKLFLRNFRNEGFLLVDLCTFPINQIKGKRKENIRSWYHEDILNRIKEESPAQGIIIIGETMGNPLSSAIEDLSNGCYNGRCRVVLDPRRKGGIEELRDALEAFGGTHLVLRTDIPDWNRED